MDLGRLVQPLVTLEHKQGEDEWHKIHEMEDDAVLDQMSKLESAIVRVVQPQPQPRQLRLQQQLQQQPRPQRQRLLRLQQPRQLLLRLQQQQPLRPQRRLQQRLQEDQS